MAAEKIEEEIEKLIEEAELEEKKEKKPAKKVEAKKEEEMRPEEVIPTKIIAEIERIDSEVKSLIEVRKVIFERFDTFSEKLGGLTEDYRSMEKEIGELSKAVSGLKELVEGIKPETIEKALHENEKLIESFKSTLTAHSDKIEDFTKRIRDVEVRMASAFDGIDVLKKLRVDVEKDIEAIKSAQAAVERYARKAEDLLYETQKRTVEFEKVRAEEKKIEARMNEVLRDFDSIKLHVKKIPTKEEFETSFLHKLNEIESKLSGILNDLEVLKLTRNELDELKKSFAGLSEVSQRYFSEMERKTIDINILKADFQELRSRVIETLDKMLIRLESLSYKT